MSRRRRRRAAWGDASSRRARRGRPRCGPGAAGALRDRGQVAVAVAAEVVEPELDAIERLLEVLVRGTVVAAGQRLALARDALSGVGPALARLPFEEHPFR